MRKLNLFTDFYELTMANSYFVEGKEKEIVYFDYFFRSLPDEGGYAIFAGLDHLINYLLNLKFSSEEIKYLERQKIFDQGFLEYLKTFKFSGDIYSFKEGSPIFPNEPILTVKGNIIECQIIETYLLATLNHQSLIATKAARIVGAAQNRNIMEFGARRAHGHDAANYGARAAYIAGAAGTSNTYASYKYGIPALGTMAHSYVQSFPSEYEAFLAYAKTYPNNSLFLVDTYDTLEIGIPNAIKVAKEYLEPNGYRLKGIRIDSGDLTYLTKEARKMLDKAGLNDCLITVSNSLDEYIIKDLLYQGAKIDTFGVGERLITAKSEAVFGGVYKLVALEYNGEIVPKIKLSDTVAKTTTPSFKQVYRLFDNKNMAIADLITLREEVIDESKPYLLFDPDYIWKQKEISNFKAVPMQITIFKDGKLVYKKPSLNEIRTYCQESQKYLWDEMKRLEKPHKYYVDLSQKLWDLKKELIKSYRKQ